MGLGLGGLRTKGLGPRLDNIHHGLTQGAARSEGGGPGVRGVDVAIAGVRPSSPAPGAV